DVDRVLDLARLEPLGLAGLDGRDPEPAPRAREHRAGVERRPVEEADHFHRYTSSVGLCAGRTLLISGGTISMTMNVAGSSPSTWKLCAVCSGVRIRSPGPTSRLSSPTRMRPRPPTMK